MQKNSLRKFINKIFVVIVVVFIPFLFLTTLSSDRIHAVDTALRTIGDKRLAVILVRKSDDMIPPESIDQIRDIVFTGQDSISNWYKKISFNQFRLSGDVFGWYLVDQIELAGDLNGCPKDHLDEIRNKINGLAHNHDGFDYSRYDFVSYVLTYVPYDDQCGGAGFGDNGGKNNYINLHLYNSNFSPDPQAYSGKNSLKHELGHNLGLYHARLLICNDGQFTDYTRCNTDQRDITDIMGGGWLDYANYNEMNGVHRISLGWVPQANISEIILNNNPQNIRLYRLNTQNIYSSKKVIYKIKKIRNRAKPENYEYYYLNYVPMPIFVLENNVVSWRDGGMRGVSLHLANEQGCSTNPTNSSCMVDISQNNQSSDGYREAYFSDQNIFIDNVAQIRITQIAHNDDYADLLVEYPYNSIVSSPTPTPVNIPTPTPTSIPTPTPTPIPGDIDQNGRVDIYDYNYLVGNFGRTRDQGFLPPTIDPDIVKNDKIDIYDYNILVGNFGSPR